MEIEPPSREHKQGLRVYVPNRRRLGRRVSQRITGDRSFYDLMVGTYPALKRNPAYARFLMALLSPRRTSEDEEGGESQVLLGGHVFASCMGRERDYAEGALKGGEATGVFLRAFQADVLPALEWEGHVPCEAVRTVAVEHVRTIVDPAVVKAWDLEMVADPERGSRRVYLDTGAAFSGPNRSKEMKRQSEGMRGYSDLAPCDLAGRLWALLHRPKATTFSALRDRIHAARAVAASLPKERARRDALQALRDISDDPYPRYGFGPYSVRLFPQGASVAGVASAVRRALLSDCYELDLAASQLAIAAADWRDDDGARACPQLFAFLSAGHSFWPSVIAHMGLPNDDASKAAVKRGTYGLVFGAGEGRMIADLRNEFERLSGRPLSEDAAGQFLTHPLIREAHRAREVELERIRRNGYVVDAFGRKLVQGQMTYGDGSKRTVSGAKAARSLLGQRTQARELSLLEPLIRLAEGEAAKPGARCDWRILCWQHDGCSIRFHRRPDQYVRQIREAVDAHAQAAGIPTLLEVKWDPRVAPLSRAA